jgi:hypothetical protein
MKISSNGPTIHFRIVWQFFTLLSLGKKKRKASKKILLSMKIQYFQAYDPFVVKRYFKRGNASRAMDFENLWCAQKSLQVLLTKLISIKIVSKRVTL